MFDQLKTDHHVDAVVGQGQTGAVANHHLNVVPGVLFLGVANSFFRKVNGHH